jgi:hypothetical protein
VLLKGRPNINEAGIDFFVSGAISNHFDQLGDIIFWPSTPGQITSNGEGEIMAFSGLPVFEKY